MPSPSADQHPGATYAHAPFIAIWETTQACALVCKHCRADAQDRRHPDELSTDEGRRLIDQVAAMGTPILVLSGGDPLQRDDLELLVAHGAARGLRTATIPAATERLVPERITALARAGLAQCALSLDGPDAADHDGFRGVPGAFARTMEAARWIRDAGVALQINTVLAAWNADRLARIAALVESLGAAFWEVFILVPTGRGSGIAAPSPEQLRGLFAELHAIARRVPFVVKIAEAPHYRRYVSEAESAAHADAGAAAAAARRLLARGHGPGGAIGQAPHVVNAGKGFIFISHVGEVFPSGFLPIAVGDVRRQDLGAIYREAPLLRALRDPARLGGRCGACAWADRCGGSRARAFAVHGDPLAEDPVCDLPVG